MFFKKSISRNKSPHLVVVGKGGNFTLSQNFFTKLQSKKKIPPIGSRRKRSSYALFENVFYKIQFQKLSPLLSSQRKWQKVSIFQNVFHVIHLFGNKSSSLYRHLERQNFLYFRKVFSKVQFWKIILSFGRLWEMRYVTLFRKNFQKYSHGKISFYRLDDEKGQKF